ncbi:peptidase inhibitor family I36 protein [Streptomyces sp. NPDC002405]
MRKFLSIGAVVAATAAAALLPAGPAAPSSTSASAAAVCAIDHFCLYEFSDGTGGRGSYVKGTDDVKRQGLAFAHSALNRTNEYWCVWSQDDYRGTKVIVQPNEGFKKLGGAFRSALPASAIRC